MRIDLSPLNQAFLDAIDYHAGLYVLIGMRRDESPMWFQFQGLDKERSKLKFKSSQCLLSFEIDYPKEWPAPNFGEVYEHFRALKYKYLHDTWPKIYTEIRPAASMGELANQIRKVS